MSQAINYPRSESKIISLFLFLIFIIFILPLKLIKGFLFSNWKITFKVSTVLAGLFAFAFFSFLIFQTNREAAERYLISKSESQLSELIKETQSLEIKFSKANAINGASDLAQKINFEKINQISYIKLPASKVVKK